VIVLAEIFSYIDFDTYKYRAGEYPYVSVMNRPLDRLRVADNQLDSAFQFLARSTQLRVTPDTRALMHFNGNSVDAVGENEATKSGTDAEIFSYDGFMKGAAFIQPAATNLLGGVVGLNPALTSLNGWTVTGITTQKAEIKVDATGVTVSNLNGTSIPSGAVELVSGVFSSSPGHPLAYSIEFETPNNLLADLVSVEIGVRFSAPSGGAVIATRSITVNPVVWSGKVVVENSDVPDTGSFAKAFIRINYAANSKASVRVKNFMVEDSKLSHMFSLGTKAATRLSYTGMLDFNVDAITVLGWMKMSTAFVLEHMGVVCPISLVSPDGAQHISPEHSHDDAGNLVFNLCRSTTNVVDITSTDIDLDGGNKDKYMMFALRLRRSTLSAELILIDSTFNIHKADIEVDSFAAGKWTLKIGTGDTRTIEFGGPVAEVRYDAAYLSDFELMVMALSAKPFSTGDADDVQLPEQFGVNLLENPCGKLNNFGWSTFPANFQAAVEDNTIGSGFIWSGTANADVTVSSILVPIASGQNYHLKGYMGSAAGTTGEYGLSVTYYAANGTTVVGTPLTIPATPASSATPYEISSAGVAGASYLKVGMYVKNGFTSTKAYWTRLKAEYGEESVFSDDSTPALTTYAP
jgi:hypothetical protein